MRDRYLKARVPNALYARLQARSGAAGQRLGTYLREALERDTQALGAEEALMRVEAALTAAQAIAAPAPSAAADHELRREVLELKLIVRELAMHHNAQILARVAAQMAVQASTSNPSKEQAK